MKVTYNENPVDFSLSKMANYFSLSNLFDAMKKTWEKEQKDLLFNRTNHKEVKEYFDLMKFFFSPPNIG